MIKTVTVKAAPHEDRKSRLQQRPHTRIDHWLDKHMANLVEDALQANPQSRTNFFGKQE